MTGFLPALVWVVYGGCSSPALAPHETPRLVSLTPPITETLGALGVQASVVGRSDWCNLPAGIEAVPPVGSALTPDLERIAQLRPTRILVDGSGGVPVAELNALAPVEVLDWLTLAEVRASVTRLGALTGQTTAAERIRASFAPLEAPPPADAPSVLLALGGEILERGEVWYIKRNSLHGAALHAAGGRNAIDRDVEGAPVLSLEALLSLDPPAILVLTVAPVTPATKQALVDEWSRLTPLRALRDGRFEVIGGPTVMATGPEILHTVDAMRQPLQRWRGE